MNKTPLYILQFEPILKEKIWGGSKLRTVLGKKSISNRLGESWEISDVEGESSIISNGPLAGKSLSEAIQFFASDLLGEKNLERFGEKFPLLIKFIDAKEDLSVQLHPGDEVAKVKHNSLGKTEMWYVVQADEGSNIIVGFNQIVDSNSYQRHVSQKTIKDILHYESAKKGDVFFVYAGLIHAIGAGVLLAEIQQTSDITYRIYDWDRVDDSGNSRELHQQEALEAIDFAGTDKFKVEYTAQPNTNVPLVHCPHFKTELIEVTNTKQLSHLTLDSFVIYMCVEGEVKIKATSNTIKLKAGQTALVPAMIKELTLSAQFSKVLQVYI
ncbi:type I phosphomannose isomerase catalytic subunit [Aquimarina intermedia]|uniref:Phosphohexomutase n=1 Tax=Aquimarina intermedia TaxID=350814 RepID=A0A5S5C2X4_9FLAO|nr:type I phosphomannose isomerase catalytic subunit [Aquimarina intermedia]TYP72968.1 mannose-6-phosphate isomerase type 1 [Aquimarina intermedia]